MDNVDNGADMDKLDAYYLEQIKLGLRPNLEDLRNYCSEKGISATHRQLKEVKLHFEASASFARWTKVRSDHFVTNLIPKPGDN